MSIKMPLVPPPVANLLENLNEKRLFKLFTLRETFSTSTEYPHWDKLFHITPPDGLTLEEWWLSIKLGRQKFYKQIPLRDKDGHPFQFLITDPILEELFKIDLSAGGRIGVPSEVINPETRNQYYISSLIEEAITSSQLEGATTTREVAKQMIRDRRPPIDRSERMILNNYRTMHRIGEIKDKPLTKELIFELQSIVTENALDDPDASGRFRRTEEEIVVQDLDGQIHHVPPRAEELESRVIALCAFANGETPGSFIHPVLRSIILHFWLAYDHPFVDGNGRTARALFYWSMLHYGFWLCEFISISHIIRQAPVKYAKAYLYTETDENDLTYFIIYHIEVLRQAVAALDKYIGEKSQRLSVLEKKLRNHILLNHRQKAILSHALRHPNSLYTAQSHAASHGISFNTAKTDLSGLVSKQLLDIMPSGRPVRYRAPSDLESRLAL